MSRWWTRSLLVGLLAAGLTLSAGGQEGKRGKGKRKAKAERVAIVDPAEAKGNIEFQIQGEYEGDVSVRGETHKVGAQVIALGGGKFEIHFLGGGLPGAGWDGEDPVRAEGALKNGKAAFAGKLENGPAFTGEIGGETLTAETEGGEIKATLKKVERKSPMLGEKPPQGAVVLFDGSGAEEWVGGKTVKLSDGTFLDVGTLSKRAFKDFKLHLEFRLAFMPNSRGQARSNSGVYLQDRYECQLLDSFGLKGENNECGGFYQQYAPSVNMCLPPLQWQTYDIDFRAARFGPDGKKTENARVTVLHNGVKIHDNVELKGPTAGGKPETPEPGPIQIQNHGDPLVFRNIWVVEK